MWPCHEDDEDIANSESKTCNSDDDDCPDTDLENSEEFPDFDLDGSDQKAELNDEAEKFLKNADSIQSSSIWFNPNEREIEDLKK